MLAEFLQTVISLLVLILLELVLSIDNILFISLVTENLEQKKKNIIKYTGVILAVLGRIVLLLLINWLTKINSTLFTIYTFPVSFKTIVMTVGGLYLIYFAINRMIEIIHPKTSNINKKHTSLLSLLLIIALGDSLFSFDSVLTAISIGHNLTVMIIAIIVSSMVLLISVTWISNFLTKHLNIKILSLSFLLLIGISLFCNGFNYEITGLQMFYIMSFTTFVQYVILKAQKNS